MPKYEQIGKGALFPQEKQNDKQPDFKGKLTINDKDYQLALWKSRTKNNSSPFLSAVVTIKHEDKEKVAA